MKPSPLLHSAACFALFFAVTIGCSSSAPKHQPVDNGGAGGDDTGGDSGSGGGGRGGTGGSGGKGGAGGQSGAGGTGGAGGSSGAGGSGGSGGSGGAGGGGAGEGPDAGGTGGDGGSSGAGGAGGGGPSNGSYFKLIKLDTTAAGAGVMGDVAKYPVAVLLTSANFDFTQTKAHGEDIRFATSDGAALPYAIESWDSAAKVAAIWVKVDVKGNSNTQSIKMSWGDAAAGDASDSHTVFDTKDGFVAVYHLSETPGSTPDAYKDATATGVDATGFQLDATSGGDGKIGKGTLLVHAKDQWIQVAPEKAKPFDIFNQMTSSIWVKAKTHTVEYQCMFSKGEGGFRIHYYGAADWTENGGRHIVETCVEGAEDECSVNYKGTSVAPGDTWFHLVAVYDHPKIMMFINGALMSTEMDAGAWKSDATKPMMIGNNSSYPVRPGKETRSFDGFLDEARVMGVAKDANWIKLEYESQRDGQKFLTFGDTTKH
jgi:hypothetical protein